MIFILISILLGTPNQTLDATTNNYLEVLKKCEFYSAASAAAGTKNATTKDGEPIFFNPDTEELDLLYLNYIELIRYKHQLSSSENPSAEVFFEELKHSCNKLSEKDKEIMFMSFLDFFLFAQNELQDKANE